MNRSEAAELNKSLPMPLYFQLKESLRKRIVTKEWKPGAKIPTEAEICELYDVSRITARKALEDLQNDGYLEKKQGKGTYVRDSAIEQKLSKFYSFSEELRKRGMKEGTALVSFGAIPAEEEIADALALSLGDMVFRVTRIRLVDEEPYAFEQSYIPCRLAEGLTGRQVSEKGLYSSLAALGASVDSAVEKFRAINLDAETARYLHAREYEAAISLKRTTYSGSRILEYCNSVVVGDFFSYTVELK